jgi:SecD/SecF fusion protein
MRKIRIDFMGHWKWLFIGSGIVLAIAIGALAVRGLNFGIDFKGGTVIELPQTAGVTTPQLQSALADAGMGDAIVQPVVTSGRPSGWLVRSSVSDTAKATAIFRAVTEKLGMPLAATNVSTIAPSYGRTITDRALMALIASLVFIMLWVSIRFEYKMAVTAIVALIHDGIITLGIYSLFGREITPNTVAALLTILGYSLYDTIVIFHRIRENSQHLSKQSFTDMANDSINQVLARSVNTALSSLIPIAVLFAFGGPTLKDFAFALLIGVVSGAYSSVAIAAPLYALWKEREPRFQALKKKYAKV